MKYLVISSIIVCAAFSETLAGIDFSHYNRDITNRNAFGLKPVQLPPDPSTNAPPEAPINVEFTGITTFMGVKKAYFRIPEVGKPNIFLFPAIAEGEKDYGIEVISVNEADGAVKISHQGTVRTLTFLANGNKPNNAALPAMPPPGGIPPGIRPVMPMPNSAVPPPPTVTTTTSFTPPAMGGMGAQPNMISPANAAVSVGVTASGARNIPVRPLRSPVTREDEAALVTSMVNIEVSRELTKDKVASGEMPPLPPTDFSEAPAGPK
jgi:hypothetical protein